MRAFTPWVAALFSRSVSVVGEMGSLFMSMDIAGAWSSILVFASLHVVIIASGLTVFCTSGCIRYSLTVLPLLTIPTPSSVCCFNPPLHAGRSLPYSSQANPSSIQSNSR